MAGATCLRRKWSVATDDWSLLGPFSIFLHLLFASLVYHDLPIVAFVACGVAVFELILTIWSACGTIYDLEQKREYLAPFLGLRVILGVLQVPACAYACYLANVWTSFIPSVLALLITMLITFSIPVLSHPLRRLNVEDETMNSPRTIHTVPRFIEFILRLFGAQNEHLHTIGALLLKFGKRDLTATDIMSGLMLVDRPKDPLGTRIEADDPALALVKRFTPYSALAYGWPIEILSKYTRPNTTIPTCRILCFLCRCCSRPVDSGLVQHDNCCRLHQACIEHFIEERSVKFGPCELVRASFQCTPGAREGELGGTQPWIVMDDHVFRKRIITIRGTLGLEDILTDALVSMVPLSGGCVHEGMYLCADHLRSELKEEIKNAPYPLLIIGHSLGGGIATCLGLLLRPEHPDVEVLAFSAPGCTISSSLSETTAEFVTCVATQDDWVPRTSVNSILELQRNIQEKIMCTQYSKLGLWWTVVVRRQHVDNPSCHGTADDQVIVCDTVTPGRVMHLRPCRVSMILCGLYSRHTEYQPYWINGNELNQIVVSAKAVEVHFLNIINDAVDTLGDVDYTSVNANRINERLSQTSRSTIISRSS